MERALNQIKQILALRSYNLGDLEDPESYYDAVMASLDDIEMMLKAIER
jgi:hypothetical protein